MLAAGDAQKLEAIFGSVGVEWSLLPSAVGAITLRTQVVCREVIAICVAEQWLWTPNTHGTCGLQKEG